MIVNYGKTMIIGGESRGRQGRRRRESALVCPHSSSCFMCPLPDCNAELAYNEILDDELYRALIGE